MSQKSSSQINPYFHFSTVSAFKKLIIKILATILFFSNFGIPLLLPIQVRAQVPIVVTADQPNVWTLEQAHYLLAQMHRRNLDLKAKGLEALDANAINGVNIDILKTLLEVGVEFSQEDLFNNRQAKSNTVFNNTRRQALIKENDDLRTKTLQLSEDIATLNSQLKLAQTQEEKDSLTAEMAQKTAVQAKVDKNIELNNNELKILNPADSKVRETSSDADFQKDKQGGLLDDSFKAAAKKIIENADSPPKLNASLQLDNYLQLQYEIISKQLTLLRDEVGPEERVIFLELPQSINAAYDKADKKWAQSWWKILGYTKNNCYNNSAAAVANLMECPPESRRINKPPESSSKTFDSILNPQSQQMYSQYWLTLNELTNIQQLVRELAQTPRTPVLEYFFSGFKKETKDLLDKYRTDLGAMPVGGTPPRPSREILIAIVNELNTILGNGSLYEYDPALFTPFIAGLGTSNLTTEQTIRLNRKLLERIFSGEIVPSSDSIYKKSSFVNLDTSPVSGDLAILPNGTQITNRKIRTIELIPRQSSLNVNDIKLRNKAGALNIVASFLFGLGANLSFQRQQEQYAQFVQQELYSSAFGKGSREFGWTFTPMPGTDRLLSGVRTTYAIVVVPQEATSIVLDSGGCYFKRSDRQPQNFASAVQGTTHFKNDSNSGCREHKAFVLPIPGGGNDSNSNDFYISGLAYQPTIKKDKRIVVSIYGENFSSQIGVLVDGVPLKQSLGIAQPFIRDDSNTGNSVNTELANEKIKGNFERIDSNQIVASFEMPPDYEGTPVITLVAPGIAIDINRLENLYINGNRYTSLSDSAFMFGKKPSGKAELKVDNVDLFPTTVSVQVGFDTKRETRQVRRRINGRWRIISIPVNIQVPRFEQRTQLTAFIYGDRLDTCNIYGNGLPRTKDASSTAKLLNVPLFPVPLDENIKFSLVCGNDVKQSATYKNPFFKPNPNTPPVAPTYNPVVLRIDKVKFISYEDSVLVVELEGIGFTENLKPSIGDLVVKSATNAVLQIDPSKASQVVTFTDANLNLFVKAIIARHSPPKTETTETVKKNN